MFTKPGSRTCCRASKTVSICPEGDCPRLNISVITPLDTTMPSDASAVVPVNVASGCLIHMRCPPLFKGLNSLVTKPLSFYRCLHPLLTNLISLNAQVLTRTVSASPTHLFRSCFNCQAVWQQRVQENRGKACSCCSRAEHGFKYGGQSIYGSRHQAWA